MRRGCVMCDQPRGAGHLSLCAYAGLGPVTKRQLREPVPREPPECTAVVSTGLLCRVVAALIAEESTPAWREAVASELVEIVAAAARERAA